MKEQLIHYLQQTVLKFSYRKTDGSVRVAFGTLNQEVISRYAPASSGDSRHRRVPSEDVVTYFDIEALAWRSFRMDRFLAIDEDYGE